MTTLEDIKQMIAEEVAKLNAIGVFPVPVNKVELVRARSFYADAWRQLNKIRVSYYYLGADPLQIRGTIMHELLHMVSSAGHGHGAAWKALAAHVNRSYPQYNIKRCGSQIAGTEKGWSLRYASNVEATKTRPVHIHVVECPCCGQRWERIRNSRLTLHPELYECAKCHVPLNKVQ